MANNPTARWIVVLNPSISIADFNLNMKFACDTQAAFDSQIGSASTRTAEEGNLDIFNPNPEIIYHIYNLGNVKGYSGKFATEVVDKIRHHPDVQEIERNQRMFVRAVNSVPSGDCWGLGAISHREGSNVNYRYYPDLPNPRQVVVYVLDCGVRIGHAQFDAARATCGATYTSAGKEDLVGTQQQTAANNDNRGHGTHVAGIIAGNTFGVARNARIISVKVVDDDGNGFFDDNVAGIQWAIKHALAHKERTSSVVNMSLGGPRSNIINNSINEGVAQGITFVAAAGNDGHAQTDTPACAHGAISVGATIQILRGELPTLIRRAVYSNFGGGIDIFAPGTEILSCGIENNNASATMSGTSMATPFVAGVAAYLLSRDPNLTTASQVTARILSLATPGLVEFVGVDSPNLFLFNGSAA